MSTSPAHPLDTGTRLAVDRTRLAHERTLMAWVRTATSLISFGFTIYKFFEFEAGKNAGPSTRLLTPRQFGMIMIGTGLIALVMAGLQHRESLRSMKETYGALPRSVAGPVAGLVALLGVFALAAVVARA